MRNDIDALPRENDVRGRQEQIFSMLYRLHLSMEEIKARLAALERTAAARSGNGSRTAGQKGENGE